MKNFIKLTIGIALAAIITGCSATNAQVQNNVGSKTEVALNDNYTFYSNSVLRTGENNIKIYSNHVLSDNAKAKIKIASMSHSKDKSKSFFKKTSDKEFTGSIRFNRAGEYKVVVYIKENQRTTKLKTVFYVY